MSRWKAISVSGIAGVSSFVDIARSKIGQILMAQCQHATRGIKFTKAGRLATCTWFTTGRIKSVEVCYRSAGHFLTHQTVCEHPVVAAAVDGEIVRN